MCARELHQASFGLLVLTLVSLWSGGAALGDDCNGNGVLDSIDIASGTSKDCNDNGVPDVCDVISDLRPGSAALYRCDDNAGELVTDFSGNGNVGINTGVTYSSDTPFPAGGNYALEFDHGNDAITIPAGPGTNLNSYTALTLEAFIKPSLTSGIHYILWADDGPFALWINDDVLRFDLAGSGGQTTVSSPFTTSDAWIHVAGSYDGATVRLFIDGLEVNSTGAVLGTIQVSAFRNIIRIGNDETADLPGFNRDFRGLIDQVRIASTALDPNEILFDATHTLLPGTSTDCDSDGVPDECLAYSTKLTAADSQTNAALGRAVDIDGDWAIAGVPSDATLGAGAGAAYLFQRQGMGWVAADKLTDPNGGANAHFGQAVAIDGDWLVVGAPDKNFPAPRFTTGAVLVYHRQATGWRLKQVLTGSDTPSGANFGTSVAIQGNTILVATEGFNGSGAAYAFAFNGGDWLEQDKLVPTTQSNLFIPDVDLDGDWAVIGDLADDVLGFSFGAAYFFQRSGNQWTQVDKVLPSAGSNNGFFGASVTIHGDWAAVGAWQEDGTVPANQGATYVFQLVGGHWLEQQRLMATDAESFDAFGISVAMEADTLLVGASEHLSPQNRPGETYVFWRIAGIWTEVDKLVAPQLDPLDAFGVDLEMKGGRAIIGATGDDDIASSAGAAYVFSMTDMDCNGNGLVDRCEIELGTSDDCDFNGTPDECQSDFDGDGLIDACDPDIDDDGILNAADTCDFTPEGAAIVTDPADDRYGSLRHDSDGDCDVDEYDFALLQLEFTGPGF